MPRQPRASSETGFYHVTTRGIDKQAVFKDDDDRIRLLDCLRESSKKHGVEVHAWCLMNNHVHLLLKCDSVQILAAFVRDCMSKYAEYFNHRHNRVGPLVQGRFWSAPIKTDAQLLATMRYIHHNPWKAGICPTDAYRWSSYQSYIRQQGSTHTALVVATIGSIDEFVRFHQCESKPDRELLESEGPLSEKDLRRIAADALGETAFAEIPRMNREKRDSLICQLADIGLKPPEISRLTCLTYDTVYRILKRT